MAPFQFDPEAARAALPPTWLEVNTRDAAVCVSADDERVIDGAVQRWIADHVDEMLTLTTWSGSVWRVRASQILHWLETSAECVEKHATLGANVEGLRDLANDAVTGEES